MLLLDLVQKPSSKQRPMSYHLVYPKIKIKEATMSSCDNKTTMHIVYNLWDALENFYLVT